METGLQGGVADGHPLGMQLPNPGQALAPDIFVDGETCGFAEFSA